MMLSKARASLSLLYCCTSSLVASRTTAFSAGRSANSRLFMSSSSSLGSSATDRLLGKPLVSVSDGIGLHPRGDVRFLDGSWWLGNERSGREEFVEGPRIAGAGFLDIDDLSSKTPDGLPHMMPPAALQGAAMDAWGISNGDHVVVYGKHDCMFVFRAYWHLRAMGHPREKCHLLDGSLEEWVGAGGPIEEEGSPPSKPAFRTTDLDASSPSYQATDPQNIVGLEELRAIVADGSGVVVDARSAARFVGEAPEPRAGLRGGHMPGALNLPITDLLNPDNKVRFKPEDELRAALQEAGVALPLDQKRLVSTCGSGVTACALLAALDVLGEDTTGAFLYDGSWCEWGARDDTPVVK